MFTGIVERTGEVVSREGTADGIRLRIATEGLDGLHHGQSISVSGVCLTVEEWGHDDRDWFEVFLADETVDATYLGELDVGDRINLERAMPADGRFDGHLVQGHVDTVTRITAIESVGEDWRFTVTIPDGHTQYLAQKGSVALDGISLTIADRRADEFDIAIVPTTYDVTTLSEKAVGDPLHLEVDVIAKYVERMVSERPVPE